jgi:hypothetical protein
MSFADTFGGFVGAVADAVSGIADNVGNAISGTGDYDVADHANFNNKDGMSYTTESGVNYGSDGYVDFDNGTGAPGGMDDNNVVTEDTGGGGAGSNSNPLDADAIKKMATDAGMDISNEEIQTIVNDPSAWLQTKGVNLSDLNIKVDGNAAGTTINPDDPAFALGDSVAVTTEEVSDTSSVDAVDTATATGYETESVVDMLGTDKTTANAAIGEVSENAIVDSADSEIDIGAVMDGTSVLGNALDEFANKDISRVIDTSTIPGKLLADKLMSEGKLYTDSKETIIGQSKIISAEFKDSNGNAIIPAWLQSVARSTSKTMTFAGMTGSASTEAMANALMEATLGVAEKEATFFQTVGLQNLTNKQEAIVNKNLALVQFMEFNASAREAAAINNANNFFKMDMKNLDNEQAAEILNTQIYVDSLTHDSTEKNVASRFLADATNENARYYDNLNAQIEIHNTEQLNSMKKFNAGEVNDTREFNAKIEDGRQQFQADMAYEIFAANAKWHQTVETANTQLEWDAASADATAALDIAKEGMAMLWDREDNLFDYIFKAANNEADRDAMILAAEIQAQSNSGGSSGFWSAIGSIIPALL